MQAMTEVQAAHAAGFGRFRDFRRAVSRGLFPAPDLELPDGPRWSHARIERWLSGEPPGRTLDADEAALIKRLEGGHQNPAPVQPAASQRRNGVVLAASPGSTKGRMGRSPTL